MTEYMMRVKDEAQAEPLLTYLRSLDYVELLNGEGSDEVREPAISGVRAEADQGYVRFATHPKQHLMMQEAAAFEAMHEQLKQRYLNQFVAVHNGEVVDSDADVSSLMERIREAYPDEIVLIRQVEDQLPRDLVVRSPRLEPIGAK